MAMIIRCKVDDGGFLPERAHFDDAGSDLRTPISFTLEPLGDPDGRDSFTVDTCVSMEIPVGWFGKLESKSGLNVKYSVLCPAGVIDSSYRGHIAVRMQNMGRNAYHFECGDKICQIIIQPCLLCGWEQVGHLDEGLSGRGAGGFGSTGRS